MHGLARVRSFSQDDAHIFCTEDQIEQEILDFNRLLFEVYAAFDFKNVSVKLALRPEKRIGSDDLWDRAEGALRRALGIRTWDVLGHSWGGGIAMLGTAR